MGLEQFERSRGAHLAGNDAEQVILHGQHVDGGDATVFHNQFQCALECLVLLAFPVKTHADGHIAQRERGSVLVNGGEEQLVVATAAPLHLSIDTRGGLLATGYAAGHTIVAMKHKTQLRLAHHAHAHTRLISHVSVHIFSF